MTRFSRGLILAFLVIGLPAVAKAKPPFNYEAALSCSDETVKSDILPPERIYILGPEKVTETYTLDNKPATHELEVQQAIRSESTLTLADVVKSLALTGKGDLSVRVYRAGTKSWQPKYVLWTKDLSRYGPIPLHARDILLFEYQPKSGVITQ